jgi:hypothetical protein
LWGGGANTFPTHVREVVAAAHEDGVVLDPEAKLDAPATQALVDGIRAGER